MSKFYSKYYARKKGQKHWRQTVDNADTFSIIKVSIQPTHNGELKMLELKPSNDANPWKHTRIKLWIELDGKVYYRSIKNGRGFHSQYWGTKVYDTDQRGYVFDNGMVTCHGKPSRQLHRKLSKRFKDAVYLVCPSGELAR
jgi:hypothetical protein